MSYDDAMEAVAGFEGLPVAVDSIINKPAAPRPGRAPAPPRVDNQFVGVLQLRDIPVAGDTPADEAVWWYRRQGKAVIGVAGIESDCGFLMDRDRFRGAHWEQKTLILNFGAISWRMVPLVRSDARSLDVNSEGLVEVPSPTS